MAGIVIIPPDIYNQWMFYVKECPGEVSAMGRVQRIGGDFVVTKIYLLEQEVGAAHTDIDAEAICKLMLETMQDSGDLCYWVHSHANMQAFWSGTDLETIRTMGKNGLCVASVFNKKGESRHAIAYKTLVEYTGEIETVVHDNVPYSIGLPVSEEQKTIWKADLAAKVRERPAYHYNHNYGYGADYSTGTALTSPVKPTVSPLDKSDAQPSAYSEEVMGILGYGIDVEARIMGMKEKTYKQILRLGRNHHKYIALEDELDRAWKEGKFDVYEYNT